MSTSSRQHRFSRTAFLIWSALLIWIATFLIAYVVAALACAHQFADRHLLGIGLVPAVTVLCSLLATLALAYVVGRALQRRHTDASTSFICFVVVATGAVALIGVLYVVLPPLLLAGHCVSGA